jgi:hypothetical protein
VFSNRALVADLRSRIETLEDESDGWLESVLSRRIIIHTTTNQSIDGSLVATTSDGLVLRAAKLLGQGSGQATPMAGEVFIPRANVAFAQLDE